MDSKRWNAGQPPAPPYYLRLTSPLQQVKQGIRLGSRLKLFVAQGFDGVEARGANGWDQPAD
jgi:hypothetical protein